MLNRLSILTLLVATSILASLKQGSLDPVTEAQFNIWKADEIRKTKLVISSNKDFQKLSIEDQNTLADAIGGPDFNERLILVNGLNENIKIRITDENDADAVIFDASIAPYDGKFFRNLQNEHMLTIIATAQMTKMMPISIAVLTPKSDKIANAVILTKSQSGNLIAYLFEYDKKTKQISHSQQIL